MEKLRGKSEGFLMDFWESIFGFLRQVSMFSLVCSIIKNAFKKEITHTFVDGWVLGNLIGSIVSSYLVFRIGKSVPELMFLVIFYGSIRVFEVIIYQINVLLFDSYRSWKIGKEYKIKSIRRMVLALLHNYIEVIFWYSAVIISIIAIANQPMSRSWLEYVVKNFLCMATFQYSELVSDFGDTFSILHSIAVLEVISGIIMTVISLARFVGVLPEVDEQE
ncbi:hypothetical protein [Petroclostridium sp. X23]|uniref:hypothetical protein n=1 Tax=Petroclostridium sp. X23 TaxID=3045146 RepID=UPI0024AE648A|nr:hypothetical protein [Petroclostridium sp. X23]WHH61511.1 hypothetical protein QKW49_12770 [Petroclostridium sp. X23]